MGQSPPAPSSLSGPQSKKKPKLLAFPEHFILSRLINRSVSLLIFKNLSEHRQVPRRPPPQGAVNLGRGIFETLDALKLIDDVLFDIYNYNYT